MGSRMAANLAKADLDVSVWNREEAKCSFAAAVGAKHAGSLAEVVKDAQVVFTMLSTPEVVAHISSGECGFLQWMDTGSTWVDCTTVSIESTKRSQQSAEGAGVAFFEAPVAGTKGPAEAGELVFLVGSSEENTTLFAACFEAMGKKSIYLNEVGKGTSMKLLINLQLAQSMASFSETVKLGKAMGLPQSLLHKVLMSVPVTAPFLQNLDKKLESQDTEANFPLKWMHKDLLMVKAAADDTKSQLVLGQAAESLFNQAMENGLGDQDFSSIYHYLNT